MFLRSHVLGIFQRVSSRSSILGWIVVDVIEEFHFELGFQWTLHHIIFIENHFKEISLLFLRNTLIRWNSRNFRSSILFQINRLRLHSLHKIRLNFSWNKFLSVSNQIILLLINLNQLISLRTLDHVVCKLILTGQVLIIDWESRHCFFL